MELRRKTCEKMKTILIFKDGELLKAIPHTSKSIARKNYTILKKHGYMNEFGEIEENCIIELI